MAEGYLRDVEESDLDLLFWWVNEEEVRKGSFHTGDIPYEEHKEWFMDMLGREDVRQFIYMQGEEPIGQARIRLRGEEAEISYSIASQYRCMGHGRRMVSALREKVQEGYPNVKRLIARVKPENTASQKVFQDCGYCEESREFVLDMGRRQG